MQQALGVLALHHGQVCFQHEMSTSLCIVHCHTTTSTTASELCSSLNAQWCLAHHVWLALSSQTMSADLQMSISSFRTGMLDCFRTMMQCQAKQDLPNLFSIMALVFTKPGRLLG